MDLMTTMRTLAQDDAGQDLLEYALLVGFITLAVVGAVTAAGSEIGAAFGRIPQEMDKAGLTKPKN